MITGVPAYVDGRMLDIAADSGVRLINRDRMLALHRGRAELGSIWPQHAIRILPGPSSMVRRAGPPLAGAVPAGYDTWAPCDTCAAPGDRRL